MKIRHGSRARISRAKLESNCERLENELFAARLINQFQSTLYAKTRAALLRAELGLQPEAISNRREP